MESVGRMASSSNAGTLIQIPLTNTKIEHKKKAVTFKLTALWFIMQLCCFCVYALRLLSKAKLPIPSNKIVAGSGIRFPVISYQEDPDAEL